MSLMSSIMINESIQCRQMRVKKANSLKTKERKAHRFHLQDTDISCFSKKRKKKKKKKKDIDISWYNTQKKLKKWAKDVICGEQTSTTTLLYSLFSTIKWLQTQTYMQHMAGSCKQYRQPTYPFFCLFFFFFDVSFT